MGSDLKTVGFVGLPNYFNINYNLYHILNFVAQGRDWLILFFLTKKVYKKVKALTN